MDLDLGYKGSDEEDVQAGEENPDHFHKRGSIKKMLKKVKDPKLKKHIVESLKKQV